jgi:photosystem II stability/assembly factor-like uncharacterized protein
MKLKYALAVALCLIVVVTLAACGAYYGSVSFVDPQHGWVTGWDKAGTRTIVSGTVDGGATWTQVGSRKSPRGLIVGWALFSTTTTGVWCVDVNHLLFTRNGGDRWQVATVSGMKRGYFSAASFASADVGWAAGVNGATAAGAGGSIAKTTDGGATWRVQKKIVGRDGSGGFLDVACPTESRCYALKGGTLGGIWATNDGGDTWTRHRLPGKSSQPVYEAIDFPTELTGWAVGSSGKIAKTTDGGVTWVAQASGVPGRLHGVCFTSVSSGFVVGKAGVILHTQDGGSTWVQQTSGATATLNSVDFVTDDEGWVAGEAGWAPGQEGVLLHTTDGGTTWQ